MFRPTQRFAAFALVAQLLLTPSVAHADTWLGGAVTDWFSPFAWSDLLGPPTASENAIFARTVFGVTPASTIVSLPGNATIASLSVDIPSSTPYVFTGSNGAVLTATTQMDFRNTDRQASNVTSVSSMRLNTPDIDVFDNAVLSLNNATVTTNSIGTDGRRPDRRQQRFQRADAELCLRPTRRRDAGQQRRRAAHLRRHDARPRHDHRSTPAGSSTPCRGSTSSTTARRVLQFADSHTVDNGVHLKATGGGDITAGGFIDVGNGAAGSLTVTGAGSTLTASGNISDWGAGSAAMRR